MNLPSGLDAESLTAAISDVSSDRPTRAATQRFVALCHRMAATYLRRRRYRGRLDLELLGLSLEDLALDCIAGLFERDAQGRFKHLVRYYRDRRDDEADRLLIATRRLVFSKVSDRLFDAYGEVDSSLSQLIRNLKRACKEASGVALVRHSRAWIEVKPAAASPLIMPAEFLEAHLGSVLREGMQVPDVLHAAAELFRTQQQYARRYPLTGLARAIRAATARLEETGPERPGKEAVVAPLVRQDTARLIDEVVAWLEAEKQATYVESGKLSRETFAAYVGAVRDRLRAAYHDARELTNYEALSAHLPGLSYEAYRADHRPVFEYLYRLARERLIQLFRRDMT